MSEMHSAAAAPIPGRKWTGVDWSRWLPWLNRGALASLDQGLVSGSNFILTILLARWLTLPHYGGYSLALSVFMLLNAVHQALLLEPMSILGASRYAECKRGYVMVLRRINAAFALAGSLLLGAIALCAHWMHAPDVASTLGALAITGPGMLLFYLLRGACYMELAPAPAVLSSLTYCVVLLGGLWVLNTFGAMSAAAAVFWMGLAAWVSSWTLGPRLKTGPASHIPQLRDVWREHWRYGRWALTATPVMWIPENISYTFAGMFLGVPQAGLLRALMNFVTPANQFATSLSRLLNPYVAGKAIREGNHGVRSSLAGIGLFYASIGLAYAAVLIVLHRPAFALLYGNRFPGAVELVPWMAAVPFFYLVLYAPLIGLRAIQSPASVFVAYCAATAVAVTLGFPLTHAYGLKGTIASLCAANGAGAIVGAWLLVVKTRAAARSAAARQS